MPLTHGQRVANAKKGYETRQANKAAEAAKKANSSAAPTSVPPAAAIRTRRAMATKICSDCGQSNNASRAHCSHCGGTNFSATTPPAATVTPAPAAATIATPVVTATPAVIATPVVTATPAVTAATTPAGTGSSSSSSSSSSSKQHGFWWWLLIVCLIGIFAACLVGLGIFAYFRTTSRPLFSAPAQVQPYVTSPAPGSAQVQATTAPTLAAQTVVTSTAVATSSVTTEVNFEEPLIGTLDDFGNATRYSDRFALNGTILDESLNAGEMIFGNAYALHDNGWVGESCVVFYYKAPSEGGRVRATGFDGIFFTVDTNKMTLSQGIAAMRQTLLNAHACPFAEIKFHELTRYGDPVKK